MKVEMDRGLVVEVDLFARRAFGRRDIRIERLDIFGSRTLARGAHCDRFDQHTSLGQMLRLNRAEVKHVAEPGDDGVARALAHECAAGRALLQAQQAGVFQRSERLAQSVARNTKLLSQEALGRQPIAWPQAPTDQLGPNLIGDLFERARSFNGAELDAARRARFRASLLTMRRRGARSFVALDIRLSHMLHWFNH